MAHVTVTEVQAWLDPAKLPLAPNDPLPEEVNAGAMVLGRLANVYDVTTWVNSTTTPTIVKTIISALVAGARYNKIYSEEEDAGNAYANKLERRAFELLDYIVNGDIAITDLPVTAVGSFYPLFYPTDSTGASVIYDAVGNIIGWEGSEDIKFTMASRF